jgi:hypothetical protein
MGMVLLLQKCAICAKYGTTQTIIASGRKSNRIFTTTPENYGNILLHKTFPWHTFALDFAEVTLLFLQIVIATT